MRRAAVALARRVHLITSQESAQQWCEKYLEAASDTADVAASLHGAAIALDCEGVRLGRFGRICLMQMQDLSGRVLLCDALRPGVIKALGPLLQSKRVTKVIHDCREDSAALYHQHGIQLQGIFDTQVAHAQLEILAGRPAYQASATELLLTYLGVESEAPDLKSLMLQDANLWSRRPLTNTLVAYAIQSVAHLLNLRLQLLEECDRRAEDEAATLKKDIAEASTRAVSYCLLNSEFPTAESMAKIGTRLWALMASRSPEKLVLKLNAGRVGLVNTPSAMQRFQDVELGDMVFCCISGVSIDGRFLYLDRYDHDWDFFDHQLRPSKTAEVGVYGREHRFSTSLFSSDVDPLLLRGLPGLASEDKAAASNAWDVSPEDLGGDPFED